jgi:hypothetical protein
MAKIITNAHYIRPRKCAPSGRRRRAKMDAKDKFWIGAASAIAVASIALSAVIVLFAPDDPYVARAGQSTGVQLYQANADTDADSRSSVAPRQHHGRERIPARDADFGVNAIYAGVGVVVTLTLMFGAFAWGDRRTADGGNENVTATGGDAASATHPVGAHAQIGLASVRERRLADRRARGEEPRITTERRQSHRRIVDHVASTGDYVSVLARR